MALEVGTVSVSQHYNTQAARDSAQAERDRLRRLLNRLDAAISHHHRDQASTAFASDADDRLYAARARILRDLATGAG